MILVTGGAGYIGSHTCVALARAGLPFLILDNFSNSRRSVLERLARITGQPAPCVEGDVRDAALLARVMEAHPVSAVIHFAAFKAVGESVREPLRYFNPVGAHDSGLIGEDPQDVPGNLLPYVAQVAAGRRERLSVYGNDYPTPDGTGVRDYIHVTDLAEGHVAALRYLGSHPGLLTVNLGTGRPVSVLEMVRGFEKASGRTVPYQVVERRPGDVAACWADPSLAERLLGWRAQRDLAAMCADAWRWQDGVARELEASS